MRRGEDEAEILDPTAPVCRSRIIGQDSLIATIEQKLANGTLTNGWMLTGPKGIGKATLAYQIAKAQLANMARLSDAIDSQADHLVQRGSHPDLFVAERQWDDKAKRLKTTIDVETIRKLNLFMAKTASIARRKIAIVDAADELNQNAANALLKTLEEPPRGALILLLAHAPGRLLPTIRSRCRTLALTPVAETAIAGFLVEEGIADPDAAARLAAVANGAPGRAWHLAEEDGERALSLVDEFFSLVAGRGGIATIAANFAGAANTSLWQTFHHLMLQQVSLAARARALGADGPVAAFATADPRGLVDAWSTMSDLVRRGDRLNANREELLVSMGLTLRRALRS